MSSPRFYWVESLTGKIAELEIGLLPRFGMVCIPEYFEYVVLTPIHLVQTFSLVLGREALTTTRAMAYGTWDQPLSLDTIICQRVRFEGSVSGGASSIQLLPPAEFPELEDMTDWDSRGFLILTFGKARIYNIR